MGQLREEYILMRISGEYNTDWFFKYFTEKSKHPPGAQPNHLHQWLNSGNLNIAIANLDVEYEVDILKDKNGTPLKVIARKQTPTS
jgi:hypothetical protein